MFVSKNKHFQSNDQIIYLEEFQKQKFYDF